MLRLSLFLLPLAALSEARPERLRVRSDPQHTCPCPPEQDYVVPTETVQGPATTLRETVTECITVTEAPVTETVYKTVRNGHKRITKTKYVPEEPTRATDVRTHTESGTRKVVTITRGDEPSETEDATLDDDLYYTKTVPAPETNTETRRFYETRPPKPDGAYGKPEDDLDDDYQQPDDKYDDKYEFEPDSGKGGDDGKNDKKKGDDDKHDDLYKPKPDSGKGEHDGNEGKDDKGDDSYKPKPDSGKGGHDGTDDKGEDKHGDSYKPKPDHGKGDHDGEDDTGDDEHDDSYKPKPDSGKGGYDDKDDKKKDDEDHSDKETPNDCSYGRPDEPCVTTITRGSTTEYKTLTPQPEPTEVPTEVPTTTCIISSELVTEYKTIVATVRPTSSPILLPTGGAGTGNRTTTLNTPGAGHTEEPTYKKRTPESPRDSFFGAGWW